MGQVINLQRVINPRAERYSQHGSGIRTRRVRQPQDYFVSQKSQPSVARKTVWDSRRAVESVLLDRFVSQRWNTNRARSTHFVS